MGYRAPELSCLDSAADSGLWLAVEDPDAALTVPGVSRRSKCLSGCFKIAVRPRVRWSIRRDATSVSPKGRWSIRVRGSIRWSIRRDVTRLNGRRGRSSEVRPGGSCRWHALANSFVVFAVLNRGASSATGAVCLQCAAVVRSRVGLPGHAAGPSMGSAWGCPEVLASAPAVRGRVSFRAWGCNVLRKEVGKLIVAVLCLLVLTEVARNRVVVTHAGALDQGADARPRTSYVPGCRAFRFVRCWVTWCSQPLSVSSRMRPRTQCMACSCGSRGQRRIVRRAHVRE